MWDVFVEGETDQVFLNCLLKHMSISHVRANVIGGGVTHLHVVENNIRRRYDEGSQVAILLDANSSPSNRRVEFLSTRDELDLPVADSHLFLLPNNRNEGDLETLLERISVAEHRAVYDCFEEYENCLRRQAGPKPYVVPDRKVKIYAYCAANGIEPRPPGRDYCDARYWDLDAGAIEPLKEFLLSLPR